MSVSTNEKNVDDTKRFSYFNVTTCNIKFKSYKFHKISYILTMSLYTRIKFVKIRLKSIQISDMFLIDNQSGTKSLTTLKFNRAYVKASF